MDDLDEKSMDSLETKNFSTMFQANEGFSDLSAVVSPRLLKSIYQSEDWIYILIDKIASKLAQIPWQVNRETMKEGEMILEPALNHPVQKMLDEPNPLQPSYAFKYACITDLSVTGNALIYVSNQNRWLVQVPTEIIWMDINGRGDLIGYDIIGVDPHSFPVGSRMKLPAKDVIHVKRPNASSVYWGLSPLIPGANSAMFNKYSTEYLLNFYRKGAQPGLVLEMQEETNEVQAKKLLQSLETAYTGRANQRRGMVLPKGVKATNLQHTLADQQLITYIQNNRETLINIFSVPKHELSIADSGSLGSEEYKTALKNFWEGPLMSIGTMFETALTARLKPLLGDKYLIKLNYSNVPILQEDIRQKADVANSMLSTMTYNEVRQRVWKMPPVEGGDILRDLRPPAPTFGGFSMSTPQQMTIEKTVPTVADENKKAFGEFLKSEDSRWIHESRQRIEEESEKAAEKLEKVWLKALEEQIVAAVKIAKRSLGKKASVPNKRKLQREIDAAMDEVESQWRDGYKDALDAQVELGYDTVLEVPFNKIYEEALQAIKARNRAGRRETLEARSIEAFDQISKTTTEKIMRAIEAGMADNLSITEIANNIAKIGANAAGRALTIARTETLIANSIGQAAAMNDASKVIPKLVKVWIDANDDRVRGPEPHNHALNSEVQPWNKSFSNGLDYPRDTKGDAGNVINCRCTMLTVAEEDLPRLGLKR